MDPSVLRDANNTPRNFGFLVRVGRIVLAASVGVASNRKPFADHQLNAKDLAKIVAYLPQTLSADGT